MSTRALHEQLTEAFERLQENADADAALSNVLGFDTTATIRVISEYIKVYTMLEECYDQTIHTQKRLNIRELLQTTTTRLLHLIGLIAPGDVPEWEQVATTIMQQTQSIELEIPIPRIVKDDQGPRFARREELISKYKKQFDEARIADEMTKAPPMPLEDAAIIVQRAERARHARHETLIKRGIQIQQINMHKQAKISDREKSANIIRNFWKKYGERHREDKMLEDEKELIGMKKVQPDPEVAQKVQRTMMRRKEEQRKRAAELKAAESVSNQWLEDNKAVDLRRRMDEMGADFFNREKMRNKRGRAPNIRPRDNVIVKIHKIEHDDADPEWIEEPEEELQKYMEKAQKRGKKGPAQPEKKETAKPAANSGGKKKEEIIVSPFVEEIKDKLNTFQDLWFKEPEEGEPPNNRNQPTDDFDVELVRKEMWVQMVPQVAQQCDDKLRRELKNLKILEARRCRKAKMPRQKKKKQRRVRDPLGGKSDEAILAELVGLGIAQNTPSTTFADFVGDYNFTTNVDFERPSTDGGVDKGASFAAVRSKMVLEAVMPFSILRELDKEKEKEREGKQETPILQNLPKGILIVGNKGTGKTTLALAAINAMGATYLNFSPSVLVGKETPTPRILILMLIKAAKVLAPSVILVDDIERMFGPRKKADASKKFKAQLRRNVRKLKPRDQVLFMATTSLPNLGKPCTSLFNRMITIPKPNFPTRDRKSVV